MPKDDAKKTKSAPSPFGFTAKYLLVPSLFIVAVLVTLVVIGFSLRSAISVPPSTADCTTGFAAIKDRTQAMQLGDQVYSVAVSSTADQKSRGLGGTPCLARNEAMLFEYMPAESAGFWMKDMAYPIDILWLDADGVVGTVKLNALPADYPDVYYPDQPASYVLEVAAGQAALNGWGVGTRLLTK